MLISGPEIDREDGQIVDGTGRIIREVTQFVVRWSTQEPQYLSKDRARGFASPLEAGEFAQRVWEGKA